MPQPRLVLALSIALLPLAGCGGDGGDATTTAGSTAPASEEERVRAAAQRFLDARDPQVVCRELVTTGFLETWAGGDQAECVTSLEEQDDQGAARVESVAVEGPRATVAVAHTGGQLAGVSGGLVFADEGGAWKLDDYEDDYLRATFTASIAVAGEGAGSSAALSHPPLRECMAAQAAEMPADQVRRFMRAASTRTRQARKQIIAVMQECELEASEYVADRLVEGLFSGDEHSEAYRRCMRRELTPLLGATGLWKQAISGGGHEPSGAEAAALAGLVGGAQGGCKGR